MSRRINSRISLKIGILVVIEIISIISSFGILAYFQSQGTFLGNSINIAGKNRFLTSNLLLQTIERLTGSPNNVPLLNAAMNKLESNISLLKQGGKIISDIEIKPLPSQFLDQWKIIDEKWHVYKEFIIDKVINKANQLKTTMTATTIDQSTKSELESMAFSLVDSSDKLVAQLGELATKNSQNLMVLQILFGILNIGILIFILYLVMKIIRPIYALTYATSEIKKGNLDVSIKCKGNDELSILSESFNSMVDSIKNYVKNQNELANELKEANEQLKDKDRLKDEFINIAAHELRTPIQPILGLSEILLRSRKVNGKTDTEGEQSLEAIIRNSKRLFRLSQDILDVSKIESHSLDLKKERFNLNDVILNIIEDYINQAEKEGKRDIKLLYEPREDIFVEADRGRLNQVISNLISNAVKFTKEGTIFVNAEKKDKQQVIVSIKDSGIGIDPQIQPRLFTKFATKSHTGTGLGLFISKNIIEAHGGRIWAENNSNGKGATFSFSFANK
ncbi:MAG: HAMP domain-containing sensor histidine kinase [Nitrososphaeraceae archaeon]